MESEKLAGNILPLCEFKEQRDREHLIVIYDTWEYRALFGQTIERILVHTQDGVPLTGAPPRDGHTRTLQKIAGHLQPYAVDVDS